MKEQIHIGLSVVGKWWFGYLCISATLDMSNRWQEPYVSSCHWCGRFFVHLSLVCLSCCLEAYASVIYQTSHSAHKYMQTECNATHKHIDSISISVCWCALMCRPSGWRQQWKNYGLWYTRACLHILKKLHNNIVLDTHRQRN